MRKMLLENLEKRIYLSANDVFVHESSTLEEHLHDDGTLLSSGDYIPPLAVNPDYVLSEGVWLESINENSKVVIPEGVTVVIGGELQVNELVVQGTLVFDQTTDTKLSITTLLVDFTGKLEIKPNVGVNSEIIINNSAIDTSVDLEQITHGIIVLGEIDIRGEEKISHVKLAQDIKVGDTQIILSDSTDWKIGDKIVLPDTGNHYSWHRGFNQREIRTIIDIQDNVITLDIPTQFAHLGVRDYLNNIVDYAEIANLTRSVKISSESPDGVRGHIFLANTATASILYAELNDLGRTKASEQVDISVRNGQTLLYEAVNQNGRYTLHIHHVHNPTLIKGNVINNAPKWGIAIHNSDNNIIESNVVVDALGAGIVTEDGREQGNVIKNNYIIGVIGAAGSSLTSRGGTLPKVIGDGTPENPFKTVGDIGHEGAGIWLHGQENYILGNSVYNARHGLVMWTRVNNQDNRLNAVRGFDGNTFFTVVSGIGLDGVAPHTEVLITNTKIYNANAGIGQSYSGKFRYNNLTIIGQNPPYGDGYSHNFLSFVSGKNWNIQKMRNGAIFSVGVQLENSFFAGNQVDIIYSDANHSGDLEVIGRLINVTTKSNIGLLHRHMPNVGYVSHLTSRPLYVYNYNGVEGDNFRLYMREQAPDFVATSSGMSDDAIYGPINVETAGGKVQTSGSMRLAPAQMTNRELWENFGVALGGSVVPENASTRDNILGFVVPITEEDNAPVIDKNSISVEYISETSVIVRWTTDIPATSTVEYDKLGLVRIRNGFYSTPNLIPTTNHEILIENLEPNTLYGFRPISSANNMSTFFDGPGSGALYGLQFLTPSFHTGQILSLAHATSDISTQNTVNFIWETTVLAKTKIEIADYSTNNWRTIVDESDYSMHHEKLIYGLQPGKSYALRIFVTDEYGVTLPKVIKYIRTQNPVSGDFNNDGRVDGRDFLFWQRGFTTNQGTRSEVLSAWQSQYTVAETVEETPVFLMVEEDQKEEEILVVDEYFSEYTAEKDEFEVALVKKPTIIYSRSSDRTEGKNDELLVYSRLAL